LLESCRVGNGRECLSQGRLPVNLRFLFWMNR
jgi:hypothetical protein